MTRGPETRYARSGDVHIAYQSLGAGPPFVGIPPFVQNVDAMWGDPSGLFPSFLNEVAGFVTLTHFDKRGTGLSDRTSGLVGIEERVDDLRAVMDALGIERCSIGGISEGGPLAMLFAALYPERVDKLLLAATAARFVSGDGYPYGFPAELLESLVDQVADQWATPDSLLVPMWMPSMMGDAEFRAWVTAYERACASPGAVRDVGRYLGTIDVRSVLPSIRAPTLIIHRTDEQLVPVEHGRYLAEHIPGASIVEIPGIDHVPWVPDCRDFVEEMRTFLTGERRAAVLDVDRVLATVLFTDIVGSTEQASALGDQKWREVLDRHDACVRRELAHFGGVEVKTTGDGFLATFDSPSRAVRAAQAICRAAPAAGVQVRAGLHTGEVERRGDDVAGVGVHVGARVAALAGPSEVLTSSTVRDLVLGSEFVFEDRGRHSLKGLDGDWQLLAVAG
jgi:class 3 adenylate cyclase/pimeloyl-ACP methyl ester carboxylesterase